MDTAQQAAFETAARSVRAAKDFEGLVRPLLEALQQASGYDSTYLTLIHWEQATQEILMSRNAGELDISEGLVVDWGDTLCRRALMGGPSVVEDAGVTYPESGAARELGIAGYASVPITGADGATVGTLCGASTTPVAGSETVRDLFGLFAVLISQAMTRERLLGEERARALAAEDRLRTRLQDIATAEHMMKTPLTVLQGWAMVLSTKKDALDDAKRDAGIEAIRSSAVGLRELVDQLLAATKADFELESSLSLRLLDVADLLPSIVTAHEAVAATQTWTSDLGSGLVARVDPAGFEQLISHLMDNAIKYGGDDAEVRVPGMVDRRRRTGVDL